MSTGLIEFLSQDDMVNRRDVKEEILSDNYPDKSNKNMLTMEVLRVIIDDDETVVEGDNDGLKKHPYP